MTDLSYLDSEVEKRIRKNLEDISNETDLIKKLESRVRMLEAALLDIANWPDGGNRYGQMNIKKYAKRFVKNRL